MDPSVSAKVEGEPKERKKIHFAVPASAPPNLDPRQVEMTTSDLDSASGEQREIRRRRPTPATLFRVADQSSPEDDQSTHQVKWVVGENGVLKPKRVSPNVYQPPSLKAVQKMAEAQMQKLGVYPPLEDPREGEEDEDLLEGEDRDQPTEQTDSLSGVRGETAKQIQTAPEEDEEEEEEDRRKSDATTEENSRGSY